MLSATALTADDSNVDTDEASNIDDGNQLQPEPGDDQNSLQAGHEFGVVSASVDSSAGGIIAQCLEVAKIETDFLMSDQ